MWSCSKWFGIDSDFPILPTLAPIKEISGNNVKNFAYLRKRNMELVKIGNQKFLNFILAGLKMLN